MKKTMIYALITCLLVLIFLFSSKTVFAKMENRYLCNVQYDLGNNIRIIEDGRQVGLKLEKKNLSRTDEKEVTAVTMENAIEIADSFMNDILPIEKYTITEKSYNEITKLYSISYYFLADGIKTQDFCFVDVDLSGNVVSYVALNTGTCENLYLPKNTRDIVTDRVYERLTEQQKDGLADFQIKDIIISKDEHDAWIAVVFVMLLYNDESVVGIQCKVPIV